MFACGGCVHVFVCSVCVCMYVHVHGVHVCCMCEHVCMCVYASVPVFLHVVSEFIKESNVILNNVHCLIA